jgi:hypothetical protein
MSWEKVKGERAKFHENGNFVIPPQKKTCKKN